MSRIAIVSASIGAGHDGAASELARRLRDLGYQVDIYDFLDMFPGSVGRRLRAAYLRQLQTMPGSWTMLLAALEWCRPLAWLICALFGVAGKRMLATIGNNASVVVSTYPMATQTLMRLKRRRKLAAPVVAYLIDMSIHRLWVAKDADLHIALHELAATKARSLGARRVVVAEPVVAPAFRPITCEAERSAARRQYGLPLGEHIALVMAGTWGVGQVEKAAADIARSGAAIPVVACGQNTQLRDRLARAGIGVAVGWVEDISVLMRAANVVVQNAGGLSCLEALATGLPVITYRCLSGHGRTNAAILDKAGLAPWVREEKTLAEALAPKKEDHSSAYLTNTVMAHDVDPALVIAGLVPREHQPLLAPAGLNMHRRLATSGVFS